MKRKTKSKYQTAFELQELNFTKEKNQIIDVIRRECESIVNETRAHFNRRNGASSGASSVTGSVASSVGQGVKVLATATSIASGRPQNSTECLKEVIIYPEMLSPEVTYELVRSIASRSQTEDEFKSLFEASRVDISISHSTNAAGSTASQSVSASFTDSIATWREKTRGDIVAFNSSTVDTDFEAVAPAKPSTIQDNSYVFSAKFDGNDSVNSSFDLLSNSFSDRLLSVSKLVPTASHSVSASAAASVSSVEKYLTTSSQSPSSGSHAKLPTNLSEALNIPHDGISSPTRINSRGMHPPWQSLTPPRSNRTHTTTDDNKLRK